MKKILVVALVTAALSGGGFLYFQGESHAAEKKTGPRAVRLIPVTTGEVYSHPVAQSLALIGKLEAQRSVNVATQVAAKVDNIVVGVNSQVAKGALLVQLDDAKARGGLRRSIGVSYE